MYRYISHVDIAYIHLYDHLLSNPISICIYIYILSLTFPLLPSFPIHSSSLPPLITYVFSIPTSQVSLTFLFEEARIGLISFTLYEAVGLRNVDPMGQQDPYVQIAIG